MSARPYDPMDMGYSYPSFGFPNEPAAVPVAEDDLISELDSILGNTPPLADAEPASSAAQVAQAVPEFDYSNLSTAQIKKLVPYGHGVFDRFVWCLSSFCLSSFLMPRGPLCWRGVNFF